MAPVSARNGSWVRGGEGGERGGGEEKKKWRFPKWQCCISAGVRQEPAEKGLRAAASPVALIQSMADQQQKKPLAANLFNNC